MATFHFELASPERLVFSGEVEHVVVPGSEGELGVLAQHAPLVASLRPGILKILGASEQRFVVRGGFAEVNPDGLTVLADFAAPIDQVDRAMLASQIKDLEEDVADATDGPARDRAATRLEQLKSLQSVLGS
ncbi:MAG TPA: F0F1 ATP synthase subunit epsilon [Xanthobacteraceae bacterium]|nr:F0F1 ATP synthase subunit epsilon [Xanthobacteraceae bacterium]